MKTYFRLLSFAKPIEKFAIPYILYTLLYVIFSTSVLALLGPLLNTLFNVNECGPEKAAKVSSDLSTFDVAGWFKYYLNDYTVHNGKFGALQFVCVIIVVAVILGNFFRYLSQRTMENMRIHTLLKIRKAVFDNVINLHLGFFNNERKGDIISKIASEVQTVQFTVTGSLQVIFKEPLLLIAYLVVLFSTSVKLTLISLLVIPVAGLIISRIVKKLRSQAVEAQNSYANMVSYLDEALSGIKIIKAFNATNFIIKRFDDENIRYSNIGKAMSRRQQLASPVSEALSIIMISFIVLYGGYLLFNNESELTPGQFIAYIALFSQLMRPAKALGDAFSNIHTGLVAGERILALIDEKPQITDAPDAVDVTEFKEGIHLNNLSFAYKERVVLKNINLIVPKGKTVALVGPSGGGKSTLMDLLPRFIEPKEGAVLIDNKDIKHITSDSLRAMMGIVNQESILFNDTIFNNIAFGKTGITQEQVEAAARIANAHNFIMDTDNGYQTNIGDRGVKLSGGQRQRISIARAVLNNPPIMLLDEATSALDTESEKLVQDALNNLMKNRTSLIIAHRLSTIQNADIIVVLEEGRIVEQGNHVELMEHNGLYRKLIDMQTFNND
ncbi:ABC transporter ATP-binding protein/permease [Mucilaginibacter sp. UR6-1]|uniref:ABC transporter ATP-binding protein n=1 Tax=Mucilaginibacter sp. UR6-1 TaxID=1435643 RepID=UPI001E5FA920|nr:ABC transporter ATP-binding protein [Mucilaginibacter sp. UR6-1]MCC8408376.1 ABC transporter ATP-binding protein/permease [Mucilaginibacter sp. UR6-1]